VSSIKPKLVLKNDFKAHAVDDATKAVHVYNVSRLSRQS
jgi:hypothetical protein